MKNITELINIKYPIFQGAMANVSSAPLVAAVSNGGGLGIIASSGNDANWVREQIRATKKLTDKPFGVNVLMLSPHAKDIAQVVIEEKVNVVTTGAGNPGPYIPAWKEAGIIVIPVIPSAGLARRMERAGADAVIAEGMEAGGHIGKMTTMALIPQVVDAVNIPVIAAGGIGDARSVLAAFALGAKGVQAGTIFLAAEETPIHDNYKQMVIGAKDTDTVVTGSDKAPVRIIKNQMSVQYLKLMNEGETFEELEKLTLGSLYKAVVEGNKDEGSFMAGQIAGIVKEVRPAKTIIEEIFNDLEKLVESIDVL